MILNIDTHPWGWENRCGHEIVYHGRKSWTMPASAGRVVRVRIKKNYRRQRPPCSGDRFEQSVAAVVDVSKGVCGVRHGPPALLLAARFCIAVKVFDSKWDNGC